jgi:hypothetical protein
MNSGRVLEASTNYKPAGSGQRKLAGSRNRLSSLCGERLSVKDTFGGDFV